MPTPRRLDSLRVAGYRSLRDVRLDLRPMNVLVGANGAGKSNLVEVFDLLGALVDSRLGPFVGLAGGASRLLHGGPSVTDRMELRLDFGANSYEADLQLGADDDLVFTYEACFFQGGQEYDRPYEEALPAGGTESRLPRAAREHGRVFAWVYESLAAYRVYHFHDTSRTAAVKQKHDIGDNRRLRADAGNLAAYLFRLRDSHPELYEQIVDVVRMVAPFFEDFDLAPDPANPERIQLEWRQRGSDAYFNAHDLSDGSLRFICLATLLLSPGAPMTLVLDEPELGLHPYALRQLAALLRTASTQRQVVVATQSVPLVDEFAVDDIVVVNRADGASVLQRLRSDELSQWLDHYSVGELWDKNVLGGRPHYESA